MNRAVKINASKSVTANLITAKARTNDAMRCYARLIIFMKDAREFILFYSKTTTVN